MRPAALTGADRLTRFEQWRERAERQTPRQVIADLNARAAAIRARTPKVRSEALPDQHEPFGWELEPTWDAHWKDSM